MAFSAENKNSEKEQNLNNQQHLTQQKNSSQIRLLSLEEIHNLENPQNVSQDISQNISQNFAEPQNQENQQIQQTPEIQQAQQVQQCFIWKNVKVADDDFKKIQKEDLYQIQVRLFRLAQLKWNNSAAKCFLTTVTIFGTTPLIILQQSIFLKREKSRFIL